MSDIINSPIIETYEQPEKLTPKNVCFYSHHLKILIDSKGNKIAGVMNRKAILFLEHDCIRYDQYERVFFCDALKGYNKSNYRLTLNPETNKYECDCQGYTSKVIKGELPFCSHLLALFYWFKIHNWNRSKDKK